MPSNYVYVVRNQSLGILKTEIFAMLDENCIAKQENPLSNT